MKDTLNDLRNNDHVESFEENNPDYYLANLFIPDYESSGIELGYYNDDKETMITVTEDGSVSDDQDILKSGRAINDLTVSEETISFDEALNHARAEFDIDEGFQRIMGVLQTRDQTVWNITLITTSFNVFNAEINAETGEILSTGEDDVMSWIQSME